MDDQDFVVDDPLALIDLDAFLDQLPEFEVDGFFQKEEQSPVVADDRASPNPVLNEIENLLMADANDNAVPESPLSESGYDKLLAEILVDSHGGAEEGSNSSDKEDGSNSSDKDSDKDKGDAATPQDADAADDPMSKKQRRQMRNRDAAVRSRERKKLYVKNLEMKSRYFEAECKRLGHLLQCCYAENHALRLCLQSRSAFDASMTKLESAVLLLESLLLGSLLWFMGITCQLSLPLMMLLTEVPPRENGEQKGLRRVALKEPEDKISEYLGSQSFVRSRRCRASRAKMKSNLLVCL